MNQLSAFFRRVMDGYDVYVPVDHHDDTWYDPGLVAHGADTWKEAVELVVIDMPYYGQKTADEKRELAEEGRRLISVAAELDKRIGHRYPYHAREKAIELLAGVGITQGKIDLIREWFYESRKQT